MNEEELDNLLPCDELNTTSLSSAGYVFNDTDAFMTNTTMFGCLGHAPTLTKSAVIKSIVLMVMAGFSLLGNIGTIFSILRKHRSSHLYTLILHLAISDISVTLWCLIGESIWYLTVEWAAGNVECKIFKFFQMFSLYLSTFIMVVMGIDRFIAVKYPLKSMEKSRCFQMVGLCWIIAAILSLPQMVVFHVSRGPFVEPFYQCVTHGVYTEQWQEQLYAIFTMMCMFFIPLAILITTYTLTFLTLHRNQDFIRSERITIDRQSTPMSSNRRKLLRKAKMKSLRISVAIVSVFLICWIPYNVMMCIFIFFAPDSQSENEDLKTGIFFFGMSNSLCNPTIYGIFHLWKPRRKELQREATRSIYTTSTSALQNHTRNLTRCSSYHSNANPYHSQAAHRRVKSQMHKERTRTKVNDDFIHSRSNATRILEMQGNEISPNTDVGSTEVVALVDLIGESRLTLNKKPVKSNSSCSTSLTNM